MGRLDVAAVAADRTWEVDPLDAATAADLVVEAIAEGQVTVAGRETAVGRETVAGRETAVDLETAAGLETAVDRTITKWLGSIQ